MSGRRAPRLAVAAALAFLLLACGHAVGLDDAALRQIDLAYLTARQDDKATWQFVELFLRVAGVVWIAVEWIAAAYLIRGFVLLRRWFSEGAR